MVTVNVGPNEQYPTHHLSLTDDQGHTLGFVLCDANGVPVDNIQETGIPRTVLRTSQGAGGYGDFEYPFTPLAQSSWAGGRGLEIFEKDVTRYYDAYRADTTRGDIVLGPKATQAYSSAIYKSAASYNSEFVNVETLYASSYTPAQQIKVTYIAFLINLEYPATVTVTIRSNSGGQPGTTLVTGSKYCSETGYFIRMEIPINYTMQAGTVYWITLGANQVGSYKKSASSGASILYYGGGAWSSGYTNEILYFELLTGAVGFELLFEYRGAMYAVINPENTAPTLLVNGYRGNAQLSDLSATKTGLSMGLDELAGKIIQVVGGAGASELDNWREIVSNTTGGICTVDSAWKIQHDTTTEYVILGCNTWQEVTGHGLTKPVRSVLVVGDVVYFAQGADTNIRRGQYLNGSWSWADDGTNKADFLAAIRDVTGKVKIWKALAQTRMVASAAVAAWGTDLTFADANGGQACGDTRITNLIAYGNPQQPWVFCEGEFGSILSSDSSSVYSPVPLNELRAIRSPENGRAAMQHDVYLYFTALKGLERYNDQHLDDLGPNLDAGLPVGRQGPISKLLGYPGRIYATVDAGDGKYSSILCRYGNGWHEIYRGSGIGKRIRHMFIQVLPGDTVDRLWFGEGDALWWIPIAPNPLKQTDYPYTSEAHIISSWMAGSYREINKFWRDVQLGSENLGDGRLVELYYQIDNDADGDAWRVYDASRIGTNLVINPRMEGATGLTFQNINFAFVNTLNPPSPGVYSLALGGPTGAGDSYAQYTITPVTSGAIGGRTFRVKYQIQGTAPLRWHIMVSPNGVGDSIILENAGTVHSNSWTEETFSITWPAGVTATSFFLVFRGSETGSVFYSNVLAAETSADLPYLDGGMGLGYYWENTEHASISTCTGAIGFDISPVDSADLSPNYSVSGKRWRYKMVLRSNDELKTPRITSLVANMITRIPPALGWSVMFYVANYQADLTEAQLQQTAKEFIDQLRAWADSRQYPLPLRLHHNHDLFDDLYVFVDPASIQTIRPVLTPDRVIRLVGRMSLTGV